MNSILQNMIHEIISFNLKSAYSIQLMKKNFSRRTEMPENEMLKLNLSLFNYEKRMLCHTWGTIRQEHISIYLVGKCRILHRVFLSAFYTFTLLVHTTRVHVVC